MSKHKHQLPPELEGNASWLAWIEIKDITTGRIGEGQRVEVEILLRDVETGVITPSDQKFLVIGDTITISPWKPQEPAPRPLPEPQYYWIQSKASQKRYVAKFQYVYDKNDYIQYVYDKHDYKVHVPAHPTKVQWIANLTFYKAFHILDVNATLEEYEKANDKHTN